MTDPTRDGRWGVRQSYKGRTTGGGTIGCGWTTEAEAQAANPPYESKLGGTYTYEPFERWTAPTTDAGEETNDGD